MSLDPTHSRLNAETSLRKYFTDFFSGKVDGISFDGDIEPTGNLWVFVNFGGAEAGMTTTQLIDVALLSTGTGKARAFAIAQDVVKESLLGRETGDGIKRIPVYDVNKTDGVFSTDPITYFLVTSLHEGGKIIEPDSGEITKVFTATLILFAK